METWLGGPLQDGGGVTRWLRPQSASSTYNQEQWGDQKDRYTVLHKHQEQTGQRGFSSDNGRDYKGQTLQFVIFNRVETETGFPKHNLSRQSLTGQSSLNWVTPGQVGKGERIQSVQPDVQNPMSNIQSTSNIQISQVSIQYLTSPEHREKQGIFPIQKVRAQRFLKSQRPETESRSRVSRNQRGRCRQTRQQTGKVGNKTGISML